MAARCGRLVWLGVDPWPRARDETFAMAHVAAPRVVPRTLARVHAADNDAFGAMCALSPAGVLARIPFADAPLLKVRFERRLLADVKAGRL